MHFIVLGLGRTGFSVLRYLLKKQSLNPGAITTISLIDNRSCPPELEQLKHLALNELSRVNCYFGPEFFSELNLLTAHGNLSETVLISSPGLSLKLPILQQAQLLGIKIMSDIELFLEEIRQRRNPPVVQFIGITGSNGKSTVAALTAFLLNHADNKVALAGNIGKPVLELIQDHFDYSHCVLELSSFQLELLQHYDLNLDVACILNLSPDHLDRYSSVGAYYEAKALIYKGAEHMVYNCEDHCTLEITPNGPGKRVSFGGNQGDINLHNHGHLVDELPLLGHHNKMNLLASLAILKALNTTTQIGHNLPDLAKFKGLEHRCELIGCHQGVKFINDSKATNVGAMLAALEGLDELLQGEGRWVLILGGDSKEADLSPLKKGLSKRIRACILMGKDAHRFLNFIHGENHAIPPAPCVMVHSMEEAVEQAYLHAKPELGDAVLLAPAAASTDMFKNFEERGRRFKMAVQNLDLRTGGASCGT